MFAYPAVLRACCVAVVLLPAVAVADPPWSQFRGPGAAAAAPTARVPLRWSDSENLVWKTLLPGRGSSSPVVRDGRIYLTAYTGYALDPADPGEFADLRLHVLCLDWQSGEVLWDRALEPSEAEQQATPRIVDHGYASPTPVVDDVAVYASFGPSGVVACDLQGNLLWRRSVGTGTAGFGAAASPIVYQDLLIMNASIEDDAIYGLDKTSGEVVWRTAGINQSWSTPTLVHLPDGRDQLVVNQQDWILGLDPQSGQEQWRCFGIEDYIVPCVVAADGIIYCSGGRQNRTIAVRAGGQGDVTATHKLWETVAGANVTSPLYHDGYLYWAHDKSLALCVRAADGEEVYRKRLPTRARVYASVVLAGDALLMTTRDAGVLVLAAEPQYRELGLNTLGSEEERFNATPAIADDSLLLRSDRYLYRIGR